MTSPTTTTGWNATAGSKSTDHFQGTDEIKSNRTLLREEYYRNSYDVMTGLRIAGTLGGFFVLVLLTLLYKSKCKKSSRVPSQLSMDLGGVGPGGGLPRLSIVNPTHLHHHPRDYGMMVGGENLVMHGYGDEPLPHTKFLNCSQRLNKPQLRLTPAHSESSDDDDDLSRQARYEFTTAEGGDDEYLTGVLLDSTNRYERGNNNHHHGHNLRSGPGLSKRPMSSSLGEQAHEDQEQQEEELLSSPKSKTRMKWLEQNIDIHVILPTPTISPSSSETFTRLSKKNSDKELLLFNTRSAGGNGLGSFDDSVSINESESEMSALAPSTSSALCYLDNLKYMDDTSSENIPTRGSDFDDQDNDSRRSIRSDSIFACYDPEYGPEISFKPPPPPPPPETEPPPLPPKPLKSRFKRIFSITPSHHQQAGGGNNGNKTAGSSSRRLSASSRNSSLALRNDEEEDCEWRMTLTQAQVHHRDSYCGSEVEYVNDYLESHRRRSSSTQTTLSDLRQCLLSSYLSSSCSAASSQSQSHHSPANFHPGPHFNFNNVPLSRNSPSPTLHVPNSTNLASSSPTVATLSPILPHASSNPVKPHPPPLSPTPNSANNNAILLNVTPLKNFTSPGRKRSYNSLRKTCSLQCDDTSH